MKMVSIGPDHILPVKLGDLKLGANIFSRQQVNFKDIRTLGLGD